MDLDSFVPNNNYRKFIPQDFQLSGDIDGITLWVKEYNRTHKVFATVDVADEEIYLGGTNCSVVFTINPVECRAELLFEDVWDEAPGHPVWSMIEEMVECDQFVGTMVGCYLESASVKLFESAVDIVPVMLIGSVRYDPLMLIVDKSTTAESILKALGKGTPE